VVVVVLLVLCEDPEVVVDGWLLCVVVVDEFDCELFCASAVAAKGASAKPITSTHALTLVIRLRDLIFVLLL
jgi:hypothetical protein